MPSNEKGKKSGMLASADQIVIKQQQSAPSRYNGMLASASEVVIQQQKSTKDARY